MLEDHITYVDLDLGLLELVVEPLGLGLNHLTGQQLDKLLLADLGEELLVELALVDKLAPWQRSCQVNRPPEL